MRAAPIFVHSLFRAGSTYVFAVFRRSTAGYWCYQEPLNEHLRHAAIAPERLLEIQSEQGSRLRHPALDSPYFWEFYQVREAFAPLFKKELSYDWFFVQNHHAAFSSVTSYFQSLIDAARGTPLFQCCRSFGRAVALREYFGGTHLHLWRNPWDQWWSFKVNDYFDATTQLILNAIDIPAVLAEIKRLCGVQNIHAPDVEEELARAYNLRLAVKDSYMAFYALWLYSFLQCEKASQVSMNIDALSSSSRYREDTVRALADLGIVGVDFADCRIARAAFTADEIAAFEEIEARVHQLFISHGYTAQTIDSVLKKRVKHARTFRAVEKSNEASRARQVALRQTDVLVSTQHQLATRDAAFGESELQWAAREASLAESLRRTQEQLAAREAAFSESELRWTARELEVAETLRVSEGFRRQAEADLQLARGQLRVSEEERKRALAQSAVEQERLSVTLAKSTLQQEELKRDLTYWYGVAEKQNRDFLALCNSRSWRMTAPMRTANAHAKRFAQVIRLNMAAVSTLPESALRRSSTAVWHYIQSRPKVKAALTNFLVRYPGTHRRMRSFVSRHADKSPRIGAGSDIEILPAFDQDDTGIRWTTYPVSVRRVYLQLKRAAMATSADRGAN